MGSLIILTISLLHLLPLFNSIIIKPWVVRILTVHHALQKILHIFRTSNECIVIHIWNISLPLLGGAALDLNSVEPKPRRWILDITWLNLVQLSSVHPFTQLLTQVTHNDPRGRPGTWRVQHHPGHLQEVIVDPELVTRPYHRTGGWGWAYLLLFMPHFRIGSESAQSTFPVLSATIYFSFNRRFLNECEKVSLSLSSSVIWTFAYPFISEVLVCIYPSNQM